MRPAVGIPLGLDARGRLRASREFRTRSGWNVAGYAETRFYDDEGAWLIGVYAQWSF